MREKLEIPKQISFTQKMANKIQNAADLFNVSFPEIVRECVEQELDKLIDREKSRRSTAAKSD